MRSRRPFAAAVLLLAGSAVAGLAGCDLGEEPADEAVAEGTTGEAPGEMSPAEAEAAFDGDSARMVAERLLDALGGEDAWEATRFLRFRWVVERDGQTLRERLHAWDRHTGEYRLEFEREGTPHVVLFDVDRVERREPIGKVPEGRAWVGGTELSGTAADSALHGAYAAFINDSYWLLMPFKWRDPGVHLTYEGRRTLPPPPGGTTAGAAEGAAGRDRAPGAAPAEHHVVHLTFEEDLGMTNDQYWGFVNPETWLMDAWQYHLQGQEEKGALIWWRDWRDVGPIRLAADRRWQEGSARIHFPLLEASETVPDGVFEPPAATADGDTDAAEAGAVAAATGKAGDAGTAGRAARAP